MATRSRSHTPPTASHSPEEEAQEAGFATPQDDVQGFANPTSLLPIVEISDETERTTQNRFSSNTDPNIPSLSDITPSIQAMLGRRYRPSFDQQRRLMHNNSQSLRRNPPRLARPTQSLDTAQRRRRSQSPSQETTPTRLRTPSPLSADEEQQLDMTPTTANIDIMDRRRDYEDLPPLSFETEREKRVTFQPMNHSSLIFEQSAPPPTCQASHRADSPHSRTSISRLSEGSSSSGGHRRPRRNEKNNGGSVQISNDFVNQLCQAFKVQNLEQLQRVLPYQPTAAQPIFSRARQQTYYENDLTYTAAGSGESESEASDEEGIIHPQSSTKLQNSRHTGRTCTDARALLSRGEKPLRGKWVPPAHIPQLDESIEDYDLWFHQMHQYLLQSCITQPADQRFLTQLHCDWDFFEAVVTRAKGMNISKETLCGSRRIFRDFVCTHYTRPEALREVQSELRNLGKKDLAVKEVWQELRRLFMSHDAKAKRQGYPELTDQQRVEYLIDGLRPRVQFLMSWLRRQRHPDLATPSTAYAAALFCEKDLQRLDTTGQESTADLAWFTPAEVRKHVRLPILAQQSTTTTFQTENNPRLNQATNRVAPVQARQTNSQLIERTRFSNLNTSSGSRQKRPFDDSSHREKMLCAFCLIKGHTALNCRKRRRALDFQLNEPNIKNQRASELKRDAAMTAPTAKTTSLSLRQQAQAPKPPGTQIPQKRSGLNQRPSYRPACVFCNKPGHDEDKCWIKHPHLKPKFPRQPGSIALQGRAQREAFPMTDKNLPVEETQRVSLDPWRDPIASQCHFASLALTSAQSSSERHNKESRADNYSEDEQPHQVREHSFCRCLPTLRAVANNQVLFFIIDTGATINLMNASIAKAMHTRAAAEPISVSDISGNSQKLSEIVTVPLELSGYPYVFDFYVTPTLPGDALLGMDAIIDAGWIVDPIERLLLHKTHALPPIRLHPCIHKSHTLHTRQKCTLAPMAWHKIPIRHHGNLLYTKREACIIMPSLLPTLAVYGAPTIHNTSDSEKFVLLCNMSQEPIIIPAGAMVAYQERAYDLEEESSTTILPVGSALSVATAPTQTKHKDQHPQADKLKSSTDQMVEKHFDLISAKQVWDMKFVKSLKRLLLTMAITWTNPDIVGRTIRGEHRINTQDAQPIALPLRRIAWVEKDKIKEEIDKMKQQGIIEDSESPWSSPPVLVRKKDGSIRFCIDYRRLNEVTVPDKYPLPRIDDVLDALSHGHYFSVIDLKSGYWQIPMHKTDAEKTAFRTYDGLYQFTVMPFGLKNAPATFQRLMDTVLSGLKWKGLLVYMDDIIIYSATPEEHLVTLADTFERLANAGLKINPSKTTLVRQEVNYLGHLISAQGISPNPDKIAAIRDLKPPSSVREVRMFLGLTGYFRKFVKAYATLAEPLYTLTKKHAYFQWSERHQASFELLKQQLCAAPVLAYPRRHRKNIVDCDASDIAAGAVLLQFDDLGNEYVIQYISCTFNDTQQRWPTVEREAYAIVWAITTFRPYLLGSFFTVRTDNSAAAAIKTARQPKLQRWSVTLAEYDFTVEYRPGKRHTHVDALSRLSVQDTRGKGAPHIDLPQEATVDAAYPGHHTLPSIDWKTAQNNDPDYCALQHSLRSGNEQATKSPHWFRMLPSSTRSRFVLEDTGIIFKGDAPGKRARWLVPRGLRQTLTERFHLGSQGAHLGATKLLAQLSLKYYWPQMLDTVRDFVKACERCQRVKAIPRVHQASRMLNREALWSTVAFDFFGPLRKTARGNVYILVGIDHFSRWPEAIATRVANAEVVASFLHNKIISQHGTPSELLSDHGTHFTSHVISLLCKKYKIRKLMSTPYTPQSNGIVERFMGYLKTALITLIDQVPTAWDLHLSAVLAAYRATPHPDSGESPFYLNKGYDPRLPEEVALDAPLPIASVTWYEQLTTTRTALESKIAMQQEAIAKKIQDQTAYQFKVGQLILIKRTAPELQQAHTKLTDKYDHLARVRAVLPNQVSYEVVYLRSGETAIINRRNLRPFYQAATDEDEALQPPSVPSIPNICNF